MLLSLALLSLVAAPLSAQAQLQGFDFNGYVTGLPGGIDFYSEVFDPSPALELFPPLDFANYQYTLVVTGLVPAGGNDWTGGTIVLYEDALVGGTAADYANPATFTDGTPYLSGDLSLTRTPNVLFPNLTNIQGVVDWTGGSHINDLAPEDQSGWLFRAGGNSNPAEPVPDGYDEQWDGKIETEGVVPTADGSWGVLKAGYGR
jgi:hypothetical protein